MNEYINSKKKIFRNSNPESTSVVNADDSLVLDCARDHHVQRGKLNYFTNAWLLKIKSEEYAEL